MRDRDRKSRTLDSESAAKLDADDDLQKKRDTVGIERKNRKLSPEV